MYPRGQGQVVKLAVGHALSMGTVWTSMSLILRQVVSEMTMQIALKMGVALKIALVIALEVSLEVDLHSGVEEREWHHLCGLVGGSMPD